VKYYSYQSCTAADVEDDFYGQIRCRRPHARRNLRIIKLLNHGDDYRSNVRLTHAIARTTDDSFRTVTRNVSTRSQCRQCFTRKTCFRAYVRTVWKLDEKCCRTSAAERRPAGRAPSAHTHRLSRAAACRRTRIWYPPTTPRVHEAPAPRGPRSTRPRVH